MPRAPLLGVGQWPALDSHLQLECIIMITIKQRNAVSQELVRPTGEWEWRTCSVAVCLDAGARMLGIVREEPSCQLGRGLQKDAVFFYIYQKKPVQSRQRFGITPRRGGGKARRIPSPPVTSKGDREKEELRLAGHQPRAPLAARPQERRETNKQTPRAATDPTARAKCRGDPAASATMRSRGAVPVAPGTSRPV